jgi:PAS domain S-box-containing protein
MNDVVNKRSATIRIVGIYALVGFLWIFTSDTILSWLVHNQQIMVKIAIFKGSAYIIFTSLLLYVLLSRYNCRVTKSELVHEDRMQALEQSEERLSLALVASKSGIWDRNVKTGEVYFDSNYFMISGYEPNEFPHSYDEWEKRIHPVDVDRAKRAIEAYLTGKSESYNVEFRFKSKDDSWMWILSQGKLFERDEQGNPVRFTGMHTDISERKHSEESLLKSEAHYRSLFDSSLIGVTVTNRGLIITDANDAFCKMLEYSKYELIDKMSIADISHPDDADKSFEMVRKLMTHEIDHYSIEKRYLTKTRKTIIALIYIRGQYNLDGEYEGTTGSILDITAYKTAGESLRLSEEKYRSLFNNSDVAMFRSRADGSEVLDVNPKFLDMFGKTLDEMIGKPSTIVWADPNDREMMIRKLLADGRVTGYEQRLLNHLGGIRNCLTSMVLYREQGILEGSILDITEIKRAEEERLQLEQQLLHAQKLESLGVLAGGIAHDFNNILTSIVGNADLALMRMNPESPAIDNLHKIEQAAARAADLAKQMLAYSGKGKFIVENLDMNRLLEEMLHMLDVSISKKAVLRLNLTPHLPSVEADATQMRQIVMNLVINASEAISDKSGVIAITTGCMDLDKTYLKNVWLDENIKEGLYVYLEVADTGCGMDSVTQTKLFDPFFTTKFTGRGLGMAAVLGIVSGHKGAIKVYSEPEKGTTFKILLPASNRPADIFNHNSHTSDWKGEGKVLLVDDEETIRGIGKEMLQEFGFTTITANDGREAVEIFKQNPDVAFVILDLTMPHMDGEQCFMELKHLKPDVKVIMSSGYSEHEVTQKFAGKGLAGFIPKPYKLSDLRNAIIPLF